MTQTTASKLDSILDAYVSKTVSLQKLCDICTGTNDECDICTMKRHWPLRDKLEGSGIYLKSYGNDEENEYGYRNSFLTGSYARGTSIRPPKDVDFFWVLDSDRYATPNQPDPAQLLEGLSQALSTQKGVSIFNHKIVNIEAQYRSICVKFDDDFSVDVIPAFDASTSERELYEIPDTHLGRYIESNPKVHKEALNEAVAEIDLPELKNVIKLARRWRRDAFEETEEKPKSFHVEIAIVQILAGNKLGTHIETLQLCFGQLPGYFGEPRIPDPACPNCPSDQWIDAYLSELSAQDKSLITDRISSAHATLTKAVELEKQGKIVPAIHKLREIFHDLPEQEAEVLLKQTKKSFTPSAHANTGATPRTRPWNPNSTPVV